MKIDVRTVIAAQKSAFRAGDCVRYVGPHGKRSLELNFTNYADNTPKWRSTDLNDSVRYFVAGTCPSVWNSFPATVRLQNHGTWLPAKWFERAQQP